MGTRPLELWDVIVIGGGFFGCQLALREAGRGARVLLVEREADLMSRASARNQARVHRGYHYPRSVMTALRSGVGFERFMKEFGDCVETGFEHCYAIASRHSKVTAAQFRAMMERIGAPLAPAPKGLARLFAPDSVEAIFKVTEPAFDASRLRERMRDRLKAAGVEVRLGMEAQSIVASVIRERPVRLVIRVTGNKDAAGGTDCLAVRVLNCTYSRINSFARNAAPTGFPLKHEITEIVLIQPPESLRQVGVTVMCGPFFSTMPFPARGLHSLSHVRYTPHAEWHEGTREWLDPLLALDRFPRRTRFGAMIADASRFLPCLREATYVESVWETKTVLTRAETDDSRPIHFRQEPGVPGAYGVLGGKIDQVFDALEELELIDYKRSEPEAA